MAGASHAIAVSEASQVGEARRGATRLAHAAGLSESRASDAAIAASELANNLVRHGGGGSIVLRRHAAAIEILALDRGRGMNVAACLRDGYSTGGTAGNGLGAVRRLADAFDAYSDPHGSALWVRLGAADAGEPDCGVVCIALAGEIVCGDGWTLRRTDAGWYAFVVDGLGHGPLAADAARAATAAAVDQPPALALADAHRRMNGTRGGAGAYLRASRRDGVLACASVGNVCASVISSGRAKGLPAQNGTLGGHFPSRVNETQVPLSAGDLVVVHSDGIGTRWSLDAYPGLATRHPAVVAGVLWRDFARGRDDATVLVVRA